MPRFSERNGYTAPPPKMVPEQVTPELRNTLWNYIDQAVDYSRVGSVTEKLWISFYKKPLDTRPLRDNYTEVSFADAWKVVRKDFFECPWHKVFDYLEFLLGAQILNPKIVNGVLAQEFAAYRVIDGLVTQITSPEEIKEIEQGLQASDRFRPVADHLSAALSLLTDRNRPDYRNSIKESISAVEAVARIVSGDPKAELGKALAILEKKGKLHGALKSGFSSTYGWTSDQNGIRHAMMEAADLSQADAKFFLIACSAFCNYLRASSM